MGGDLGRLKIHRLGDPGGRPTLNALGFAVGLPSLLTARLQRVKRLPRDYVGTGHETIGRDLLAVLGAVSLPERTLGPELYRRLKPVRADGWYPISLLLEALETLEMKLGDVGLRNVGLQIFRASQQEVQRQGITSARQFIHALDAFYRTTNRGQDIGGWKVLDFEPGWAVLEKTTPHPCVMEEGIVLGVTRSLGLLADVSQDQCFRMGAEACQFIIRSPVLDSRWTGQPKPPARSPHA